MADNSAKIAAIRAILESGATQGTVDGRTVVYDHASLRRELRELEKNDDAAGGGKRPVASRIKLN